VSVVWRFLYTTKDSVEDWTQFYSLNPRAAENAVQYLTSTPDQPSAHSFPELSPGRRRFDGRDLPAWVYLLDSDHRLTYLIDRSPLDGGTPIAWLARVYTVRRRPLFG
jgi:hypothetical protein